MRLLVPALLLAFGTGCGWLSGTTDPALVPESTATADAPACRPATTSKRGPAPWKVGDTLASWEVTAVDDSHLEFARFTLTQGESKTVLEVAFHDGEAGDWTTERTRLMPAPGEEPPQDVLQAAIAHLRTFDAAHASDPAYVQRTEGQHDPYAGLPPCDAAAEAEMKARAASAGPDGTAGTPDAPEDAPEPAVDAAEDAPVEAAEAAPVEAAGSAEGPE